MNLLVVDDHALFREGLRALLANISPGVSIKEAASVETAAIECKSTQFRMVLLDLGLATTDGLETLERFRLAVPEVPVIVLSGDQDPRHIRAAIDLGAVGFIPKAHTSELMIAALRFVLAGGVYLPPSVLEDDINGTQLSVDTAATVSLAFARLSPRQQEVAQLLLQGAVGAHLSDLVALAEEASAASDKRGE